MSKHTQGQWAVTDDRFIAVDDVELICEVYDRANFIPRGRTIVPDEETAEANLKLICASPDLLHALESFVVSMDYSNEQFEGHNEAYRRDVCLARALDAIKKATV